MTERIGTRIYTFPQTLLGRVAAGIVTAALLVSAVFFFFLFLLLAGALVLGISLRVLWLRRQFKRNAPPDVIEGEYSIEQGDKAAAIPHRGEEP